MDYGLVSIITPTFNSEKYIKETIQSVINQTYQNWELLITDDCSTDNTIEIIMSYCELDKRIKLFKLNKNSGAGTARNNSIKEAQGEYMAFLDSDDLWLPYKLERQITFMKENNVLVSHTSSLTCDESGKIYAFNPAYKTVSYRQICNCDKCGTTELVYNMAVLGKFEMPSLRKRQDWAFKILLLQKAGTAFGMYDTLSIYRTRSESLSRKKSSLVKYNIQVYRTILNLNVIHSYIKFIFQFMPSFICKRIRQRIANSSL